MPFTVTMPKLSPTMEEGVIAKWRKKVGDHVLPGDVLFEVATDKATVEHSAIDGGYLRQILIGDGKSALVNQAVAIFTEKADESIVGYVPEGVSPQEEKVKVIEKEVKAKSKAAEMVAPTGGMQMPAFVPEPPMTSYKFTGVRKTEFHIKASPLAKKMAQERNIDLATVKGSGPHGRIESRDLDLGQPKAMVAFGKREIPEMAPGTYEEEPLSPMRKIIGQRLQESKTFVPHFYVTQEICADALVQTSLQLKEAGIKATYNDFIVRAAALALREHPEINSGYNSVNASIIRFKTIDISIAVTVAGGLITPIIRHADYKNLGEISSEVKALAARAKEGKLAREEYMGGSFTVSNLGMFGISEFIGVINPPQAALLAIGGIEEKPVVKEGQVVAGKTLRLTLSADHRVIDGAEAAKFLKSLKKLLENPALLLI